jgi:hypothetical protein
MFLGEMSRLTTLSSKLDHYLAAMRGLVALYIRRGYLDDEVHKWLYSNLSKRWESRLHQRDVQSTTALDVLVLKTQYNLAWNYFNAHNLGDIIFGYWREWLDRAVCGDFNSEFPALPMHGPSSSGEEDWALVLDSNILKSRVLLSRKKTRQLLDLTNLWKQTVIGGIEGQALDDNLVRLRNVLTLKRPEIPNVNEAVMGQHAKTHRVDHDHESDDDSHLPLRIRFPSPTSAAPSWALAPMGQ